MKGDPGAGLYLDLLKKCLTAELYDASWDQPISHRRPAGSPWWKRAALAGLSRLLTPQRGWKLLRARPVDLDARRVGADWPAFGFSMAGARRLDNVQRCVEDVLDRNVPGDLIETGVWMGGVPILMNAVLRVRQINDRRVWLADSFEGLPAPTHPRDARVDLSRVEYLKVPLEDVKRNFERFGLLDDNVRFVKGWFRDTLPTLPIDRIAVLRLDGDLYESTRDALRHLHHKVSPGGYVIIDDFGAVPACREAVEDFRAEHGIDYPIVPIDWTGVYWRIPMSGALT